MSVSWLPSVTFIVHGEKQIPLLTFTLRKLAFKISDCFIHLHDRLILPPQIIRGTDGNKLTKSGI